MPGIFLGVKFQAHVFFWVRNMKFRGTPLSCILQVPSVGHLLNALFRWAYFVGSLYVG